MKRFATYFLTVAFLLLSVHSVAQRKAMLSGLVVDENNKPIAGAIVRINNQSMVEESISDQDGLYYTHLIPKGGYWVHISAAGHSMKAGRIYLRPPFKPEKFFNFKISDNKASIHITDHDPFATAYFNRVRAQPLVNDFLDGPRTYISIQDSTGKLHMPQRANFVLPASGGTDHFFMQMRTSK